MVSKLKASSQRPMNMETLSQVRCVSSCAVMVPIMPIISPVCSHSASRWPGAVLSRAAITS